jgi:hypothetical protein
MSECAEEGAKLELRVIEGQGRYYLGDKPVEDGMELELRLSQRRGTWLRGMWEWNGDPKRRPTFQFYIDKFYIEPGIAQDFWKVKFRLQEYARFRWPR